MEQLPSVEQATQRPTLLEVFEDLASIVAAGQDEHLTRRDIGHRLSAESWDFVSRLAFGYDETPMDTIMALASSVDVITYDGLSRRYGLGRLGSALINASFEKRMY